MQTTTITKQCPLCAEDIHVDAIKCKHCGEMLNGSRTRNHNTHEINFVSTPLPQQYRKWSPGIAALLSFLIPGAGQMYKGDVGTGLVWFLFVVIGYVFLVIPGIILHLICIITAASGDPYK